MKWKEINAAQNNIQKMWMHRNASQKEKQVNVSRWSKINYQDATIFNKSNEIA